MNKQPDTASDAAHHSVAVTLGARSYDIHIGSDVLHKAGDFIAPLLARPKVAIVTDTHVAKAHLPTLQAALKAAAIEHTHITLEAGEQTKSFDQLEALCNWLLAQKIERNDCVIALGGGVIGDLTGFAAAILRRGTRFIQIPTTLLAQVDSSIGGKTAINATAGKNPIGAFHQPDLVLADTSVLASLPARQLRAGYAEIVKYGALGDAAFFDWLEKNGPAVVQLDAATAHAVAQVVPRQSGHCGAR